MKNDNSQNKWQVFFMLIFIPGVFAVILAVAVLSFMNVNIVDNVKQVVSMLPFVDGENEETIETEENVEEMLVQLEHENSTYLTTIQSLEYEMEQKNLQIIELEERIDQLVQQENENEIQESNESADYGDIVRTLEGMTASKAAQIVSEMEEDEAVLYLRLMNTDARSQILSRVDPSKAANIISKLVD
ncbi:MULTISPECIES: MotE family protein [Bacillaceae]|uniref:Magnesium transporter MgtE intracellular domain-containing protein n=1 Tax=Evansella alkalicola TaxID=745819 RepID=A0ABS6JP28_9BACI|nr:MULTISPECIES: hypothetical protein [Bacillaceae]MBU9720321.1 hypothetical protein [Bacillus alkalicola]